MRKDADGLCQRMTTELSTATVLDDDNVTFGGCFAERYYSWTSERTRA
jgi:hypothetical protein